MISLRHVGLIVRDIDKSLHIYRDILNFKPKIDQIEHGPFFDHLIGFDNAKARTTKCYAEDESCIELIQFISHRSINREKRILGLGFNHIALNVENVDDVFKKLVSLGLQYVNEPKVNNEGTAKVSFCRDYEDNLLELVQLMKPVKVLK